MYCTVCRAAVGSLSIILTHKLHDSWLLTDMSGCCLCLRGQWIPHTLYSTTTLSQIGLTSSLMAHSTDRSRILPSSERDDTGAKLRAAWIYNIKNKALRDEGVVPLISKIYLKCLYRKITGKFIRCKTINQNAGLLTTSAISVLLTLSGV